MLSIAILATQLYSTLIFYKSVHNSDTIHVQADRRTQTSYGRQFVEKIIRRKTICRFDKFTFRQNIFRQKVFDELSIRPTATFPILGVKTQKISLF